MTSTQTTEVMIYDANQLLRTLYEIMMAPQPLASEAEKVRHATELLMEYFETYTALIVEQERGGSER